MKNYIDIDQRDQGAKIYRVFTIERLIEMFEQEKNALVKPELWDDPFENFILSIPIRNKDGKVSKSSLRKRGYGQCWTFDGINDYIWFRSDDLRSAELTFSSWIRVDSLSGGAETIADYGNSTANRFFIRKTEEKNTDSWITCY